MARKTVVIYFPRLGVPLYTHEKITLSAVAKAIARINDDEFAGCYDKARHDDHNDIFFVPSDALILNQASELGIHSPAGLFGAIVPYPFVKTKAITHRLVNGRADRPEGWSSGFAQRVRRAVLPGFTAFSAPDARLAAAAGLQAHGAIRVKDPLGRDRKIPPGSVVHFQGDDPEDGPLLRYTVVTRRGTQPSLHFANGKRCARVGNLGVMPTSKNRVAADS